MHSIKKKKKGRTGMMPSGEQDPDNFYVKPHVDMNDIFSTQHAAVWERIQWTEAKWLQRTMLARNTASTPETGQERASPNQLDTVFWLLVMSASTSHGNAMLASYA
jgi:hypothetical protein